MLEESAMDTLCQKYEMSFHYFGDTLLLNHTHTSKGMMKWNIIYDGFNMCVYAQFERKT